MDLIMQCKSDPLIVVYSVITGGYDRQPQIVPERNVEYWLFTDNLDINVPMFWNKIFLANPHNLNNRRLSRLPKICPHRFLPPHEVSVYTDANVQFFRPIRNFSLACIQEIPIAVHRHPKTNCLYEEGEKCIRLGLDSEQIIRAQLQRYRSLGFPPAYGLSENNFLVRRNLDSVNRLGDLWHDEYYNGSQRDQVSFMYCAWRSKMYPHMILQNSRRNRFFRRRKHAVGIRNEDALT